LSKNGSLSLRIFVYVYERGAAAPNNCGAVDTTDLSLATDWTMDMLMCGVGFNTVLDF